ncbi:DUF3791 domain-containing protein [Palleniella muris]|uniref:DUF3791 domain-containing protein n=1 Tax=Palleniella muris TaxID=3038145 RepID=A0AC61QS55_9BACT|nr:DUF3791 domain-containing protein [Palleniella muris]TGX83185.1 DUF3791 domain-containing protein [Palleniella muris]
MDRNKVRDMAEYTIALTNEFAKAHGLTDEQAFRYMDRFEGLDFILDNYEAVHTQSFFDMVEAVGTVCRRNGGELQPNDIKNYEQLRKI